MWFGNRDLMTGTAGSSFFDGRRLVAQAAQRRVGEVDNAAIMQ